MPILSPTNLETATYGTVGWNAIYSSNFQKINDYFTKIQDTWSGLSSADNDKVLAYNHASGKWTKRTLQGTSSQVNITFTSSAITISLPQNIHTGATPTFLGLNITGNNIIIATARTINSANETGTKGTICWDNNYLYICTDTNTWKRVAINSW